MVWFGGLVWLIALSVIGTSLVNRLPIQIWQNSLSKELRNILSRVGFRLRISDLKWQSEYKAELSPIELGLGLSLAKMILI